MLVSGDPRGWGPDQVVRPRGPEVGGPDRMLFSGDPRLGT
jgi:hypothetical protein